MVSKNRIVSKDIMTKSSDIGSNLGNVMNVGIPGLDTKLGSILDEGVPLLDAQIRWFA